ncbi:zinc finger protein 420-like [Patiria miniata]|uniref:C2H2-type domain-containing protein n=1 Tax=Patiria miniata TaxID=46514 RepID=A0A914AEP9_PATMI|nr:zinc finger protein 420-like [Patiria miniata]
MDTSNAPSLQREDTLIVPNNPIVRSAQDRILQSLPQGLRYCVWMDRDEDGASMTMRKGIFTSQEFQAGLWFGPYEGSVVLPSAGGVKNKEMWELHCSGKLCHYIDDSNDEIANWMRYVRCSKDPGPDVNLLAYQHRGAIYYHSFAAINPGKELHVCLQHFKLEEGLSGLGDQPHMCTVCRCVHLSQTLPAVRYVHKEVPRKKTIQPAKTTISPVTAATKRLALNSKIDKLRQKLKVGTGGDFSSASTHTLNFKTMPTCLASGSTSSSDSTSSCGVSKNVYQNETQSKFPYKRECSESSSEPSFVGESRSDLPHGIVGGRELSSLPYSLEKDPTGKKNSRPDMDAGRDCIAEGNDSSSSPSDEGRKPAPSLVDLLSTASSLSPPRAGVDAGKDLQVGMSETLTNSKDTTIAEGTSKMDSQAQGMKPYYGKMVLTSAFLKEKCKALVERVEKLLPNRQFFCLYCGWRFRDLHHFIKHKRRHVKLYRRVKGKDMCKELCIGVQDILTMIKGRGPFVCSVCNRSFKEIHKMKMHERSHANHTCRYCGRMFGSSTARIVHERAHTGECPYPCDECPKAFRTNYMRTRHKQQRHNTEWLHKCEFCDKKFKVRSAMTTHMKTHDKKLPCPVCGKNFALPRDLLRHVKTHTNERPFQCEYCQKCYKQKSTLTTHIQKHFVGDFACQYCPLKFRTVQAHARHESTHTGVKPVFKRVEKPFPCRYCDRVFPRNVKRKVHERVHTGELPFQCELCEKAYSSKKGLESHMRTHSDERPYPCLVCGKSFKERNTLKCHMRIHTGVRPFKCEQCDKTFRVSDALKKHRRSHSDERAYKCQQCEKAFKQLSALRKHERWHIGLRPHICDICGRDFVDRYRLRIHQSIHLEVRPHKCNMCDKSFTEACRLKRHLREHENRREFGCEICNKKFNFKDQLETHVKTHSEERPFQCQNCPKCFKNSSALHRHQRVHSDQSFCCPVCNKGFKFMKSLRKHTLQHLGKDVMSFAASSSSLADLCGIIPPSTDSIPGSQTQLDSDKDPSLETIPFPNHFIKQTSSSQSSTHLNMYRKSLGMYPDEFQDNDSDQSTIVDEHEQVHKLTSKDDGAPDSPVGLYPITPLNQIKVERFSEDE